MMDGMGSEELMVWEVRWRGFRGLDSGIPCERRFACSRPLRGAKGRVAWWLGFVSGVLADGL